MRYCFHSSNEEGNEVTRGYMTNTKFTQIKSALRPERRTELINAFNCCKTQCFHLPVPGTGIYYTWSGSMLRAGEYPMSIDLHLHPQDAHALISAQKKTLKGWLHLKRWCHVSQVSLWEAENVGYFPLAPSLNGHLLNVPSLLAHRPPRPACRLLRIPATPGQPWSLC